jgi:hypothetical protein
MSWWVIWEVVEVDGEFEADVLELAGCARAQALRGLDQIGLARPAQDRVQCR